MTTNSPNQVDGDVQAHQMPELTQRARQAVIEFCIARIAHLERCIKAYPGHPAIKVDLLVQQVALATLTAEPDVMISQEGAEAIRAIINREISSAGRTVTFKQPSGIGEEKMMPLYTAAPAQILRPVELPESYDDGHGSLWLPQDAVISSIKNAGGEVKND